MADTQVKSSVSNEEQQKICWGPFWTSTTVGAVVWIGSDDLVYYAKTTNGGTSWGSNTQVVTNTVCQLYCYQDPEAPEDVYIWAIEQTNGVLKFRSLDIDAATLGTEQTVATLASSETALNSSILTGAKSRGANLYVCGRVDATTDTSYHYRSTDGGAVWTSRATAHEANSDHSYLFAANTADTADMALIYYDDSAGAISVKMYDDSLDTWTETAIRSSVDPGSDGGAGTTLHFHATQDPGDWKIYVALWNVVNVATADLVTSTVTPDSIAAPTVANNTNVLTDQANSGLAAISIDHNGVIRVAYGLGTSWRISVDIKFKVSSDSMSSWGTQQDYSVDTADDLIRVSVPPYISSQGGIYQPLFENDDLLAIYTNLDNDVVVAAASGATEIAAAAAGQATTTADICNLDTPPVTVTTGGAAGEIDVSWTDQANETGYKVKYRETLVGGGFTVHEEPADSTSYTIQGLKPGVIYDIRVTAFNGLCESLYDSTHEVAAGIGAVAAAGVGAVAVDIGLANQQPEVSAVVAGSASAAASLSVLTATSGAVTGRRMAVISIEPDAKRRVIRFGLWYIPVVWGAAASGTSAASVGLHAYRALSAAAAGLAATEAVERQDRVSASVAATGSTSATVAAVRKVGATADGLATATATEA